jgi:hypothetical protein
MTTITQTLTAPPSPVPDKDDMTAAEFQTAADAYHEWTPTQNSELTAWTGQVNTVAGEINTDRLAAAQSVVDAASQVSLAEDQVTLAAEQVSLAADQVTLAESAALSAALSANVSVYSSGVSYSAGQVVLDALDQYAAYTSQQNSNTGHQPSTDAGTYWKPTFRPLPTYQYDDRDDLRSLSAAKDQDAAIIDGLGLFVFASGSDEPDDDESCFATSTGRWLLEAAHWDLVDTWQSPDDAARDEDDEDEHLRFASSFASKVLYGTATCAITSVATVTSTSFTGTVTGAAVGDRVYVNPPASLGTDAASTGRLSYHAYISAANTVTIQLCNASAATATTNTSIRTAWPVMVFKEI